MRLAMGARGAAIRVGVGIGGVEALGDEVVEGDALGLGDGGHFPRLSLRAAVTTDFAVSTSTPK